MTKGALDGRTAIVTGASRGIGEATARSLDRAGARVALVARRRESLEAVANLLHDPVVIPADLAFAETLPDVIDVALAELGGVDILVNNAAMAARLSIEDTDPAIIDAMLAVNVRAPLILAGLLVPSMKERCKGAVINLSSVSGVVGTPRRAAYAASKGALDAATRSLAIELGPFGIRVNSVAPGVIDTDLWAKNKAIPGVVESIEAQTPLRRWGVPEEVADVIVFLASDAARFVTGQIVAVDGGMSATLDIYGGSV